MAKIDGYDFPEDLHYHREHMWVKMEGDKARVGYNAWAQSAAGKILNLNLRKAGSIVQAGKTLGTIESGKWVGPLKAPLSGKILEVNEGVLKKPSLINEDPYGKGWIAVIEVSNLSEVANLIGGQDRANLEAWLRDEIAKHKV